MHSTLQRATGQIACHKRQTAVQGFTTRFAFEDLMVRGHVDVVQPSSVRSGGMREIAGIAEAAYRRGLLCVPYA